MSLEDGYYWYRDNGDRHWTVIRIEGCWVTYMGSDMEGDTSELNGDTVPLNEPE